MNFERGKDVLDALDVGINAKLKKYAPDIIAEYLYEFRTEETVKEIEGRLTDLVGAPIEVTIGHDENITVKLKIGKNEV